jgi:hypothetical protein
MPVKSEGRMPTPDAQLRSFISRFDPKDQKLMRSVRAAVRKRLPTANELAYDYAHQVVVSYTPTEAPTDGIVAIAVRADGVRLYLMGGRLPDPLGLLQGSGRQTRFMQVERASQLSDPAVEALIAAAIGQARVALPTTGRGQLIMRSGGATQRPRRKPTK